jgi:hypothetical protein
MNHFSKIDAAVTELAQALYAASPLSDWESQKLSAAYAPSGSQSMHRYTYVLKNGATEQGTLPADRYQDKIEELTLRHWQLTQDLGQARWYKMIVTVERSGKFNVEFEYKDDYKEGDILQRD